VLLRKLAASNKAVFIVSSDIEEILTVADRVIVMARSDGGTKLEAIRNPRMELEASAVDECLAEARRRAQAIEVRVFPEVVATRMQETSAPSLLFS